MSQTQVLVNGDSSSKLIDNFTSLPVVSYSIDTFKQNPYGAKSLSFTQSTYSKYVEPYLPYASKPYGYVAPYVAKADSLASDGLTKVEHHFPLVTKQPSVIKQTLLDYAFYPLRTLDSTRSYVVSTYTDEYHKCGGPSDPSPNPSKNDTNTNIATALAGSKALITTSLNITSDILAYIGSVIGQTRQHSRDFASAKYHQAQTYASQATQYAGEKRDEAVKYAQEKGGEVKGYAYASGKEIEGQGKKVEKKAKDTANKASK